MARRRARVGRGGSGQHHERQRGEVEDTVEQARDYCLQHGPDGARRSSMPFSPPRRCWPTKWRGLGGQLAGRHRARRHDAPCLRGSDDEQGEGHAPHDEAGVSVERHQRPTERVPGGCDELAQSRAMTHSATRVRRGERDGHDGGCGHPTGAGRQRPSCRGAGGAPAHPDQRDAQAGTTHPRTVLREPGLVPLGCQVADEQVDEPFVADTRQSIATKRMQSNTVPPSARNQSLPSSPFCSSGLINK